LPGTVESKALGEGVFMSRQRNKRKRSAGTVSAGIFVALFLVVMAVQIYRVKQKDDAYTEQMEELQAQLDDETERATEIDELEEYMKSDEYIEDTAKSKLGLAYENEIIFKETDGD
jgi:cell division protein DivIC